MILIILIRILEKMFSIKRRVCFADTDAGGITYHSKYLDFCEQARLEFLIERGITQRKLWSEHNMMMVLRSCNVEYIRPTHAEDLLTVTVEDIIIRGPIIKIKQNIYDVDDNITTKFDIELVAVEFGTMKLIRKIDERLISCLNLS